LKEGGINSRFFHLSTIIRRKQNSIDAIESDQGNWNTDSKEIRELFLSNFQDLFSEEEVWFPNDLENLISPCISEAENSNLCTILTPQEIKSALFDMLALKSPGLDGLPLSSTLLQKVLDHNCG
jgi:hypothetical protein